MIGTELEGRYRILAKVGEGGMGEVYLAEHLLLGRREALKVLRPVLAASPQMIARFRREARAANRVQHPNIVSVYDFGQLGDGRFYLSMEYADGELISAALRRAGHLPLRRTLHVLAQLAAAVDHAHGLGVIHRDLKPQNLILVEHRGQHDVLKVVDFGVAKIIDPDYIDSVGLTRQGQFHGSPPYMAPEVIQGVGDDPRSDLYSIGCIAFEMLTGDPPFVGTMMGLMTAHVVETPAAPSARRPGGAVPPELDRLVLRLLEKDPARRFQTARELLEAVRATPGYGDDRTPPGRMSLAFRATAPGLPAVPRPNDYDDASDSIAETSERDPTGRTDALASGKHELLDPVEARADYYRALRTLAEAMVDDGSNDVQLSIGVAYIAELESWVADLCGEMQGLETHSADVERRGHEREASLRFASGELRYEREQALRRGEPEDTRLDRQIAELERRLASIREETERELAAITDRGISLAAAIADREEKLDKNYDSLARLAEQLLDAAPADARLQELHARMRAARQMFEVVELIRGTT